MTQLSNIDAAGAGQQAFESRSTLNDLDLDDFLNLMIAELQNQDPLNPLENNELIAQIGQIRSVGATDKLTETLDAVLLGQNISSATNLIGAEITGLSDDNQRVDGIVDRISVAEGQPKLHLDLESKATASEAEGNIEKGDYQYRVVWQDTSGTLFGVDPLVDENGVISVSGTPGVDQAIRISNLPTTNVSKQIYRTNGTDDGKFHLVGTLADGGASSFLDTSANAELSNRVLTTEPQRSVAKRSFVVNLNNVGEVRPPEK